MSVKEKEIREILVKIDGLIGYKVSNVSLGIGSYLTMDFGKISEIQVSSKHKVRRGEWHLWIQYCPWRIEAREKVIAGSDDPRDRLERAIKYLEGQTLESVIFTAPAPDVSFIFGKDIVLKLFPFNSTGEYEDWCLYTPDRNVLVFGGAKPWSYFPSNTSG